MKKYLHTAMTIASGFLVMLAVFLVRAPAAYLADTVPELRSEFMNESDEMYAMCWSRYSILLGVLTMTGGFLYVVLMFVKYAVTGKKEVVKSFVGRQELQILLVVVAVAVILVLISKGPEYIKELIINLLPARLSGKANVEPDVFSSVVELRVPEIVPKEFRNWLLSYVPGQMFTVLNGVGGLPTVVLCLGGILLLVFRVLLPASFSGIVPLKRRQSALLLCILVVWIIGCFIATKRGVRFVEHLGVPTGITAGLFAGWIAPETDKGKLVFRIAGAAVSMIICVASVAIPLSGVLGISRYIQPCVTDASDRAMNWIKDNAEDPEAVIASWWDMGYFYGYASGHPTLWDGGCQTGTRAMLVAKALTTHDPEESEAILQMLANEGNRAVDYLKTRLSSEDAFHALWEAIMQPKPEALDVFEKCGFDGRKAREIEKLVHPSEKKEIYLVLTNTMMDMLGWFEYYADWDFEGDNKVPYATVYYVKSDGTATMDTQQEEAKKYFAERSHETIWRLFLSNGERQDIFENVYETTDPFAYVQVWKLKETERKDGQ